MQTSPPSPNHPGLFVAFEGIDGSGTTTVSHQVADVLGNTCLWTNEPSSSEFGLKARHMLTMQSAQPIQLAMLFALDRFHHNRFFIEPALRTGQTIICDRYLMSSLAYQMEDGISRDVIYDINPALRPDMTIFLQCPVEVAEKRRLNRSMAADRFEVTERQRVIAENYQAEIEAARIGGNFGEVVCLDAQWTVAELVRSAVATIKSLQARREARGLSPLRG